MNQSIFISKFMENLAFILSVAEILAVLLFLYLRVKVKGIPALLSKTFASFLLVLLAVVISMQTPQAIPYASLIVVGLILSMLGDVFLDLKVVYPQDSDLYLYSGMLAFSIAHIFYAVSLWNTFSFSLWSFFTAFFLSGFFSLVIIILEKPLKMNMGKFKTASFIYATFLTFTLLTSLVGGNTQNFSLHWKFMIVGASLFLLSDLILSQMYFRQNQNTSLNVVLNHVTYYIAQFFIVLSIAFI